MNEAVNLTNCDREPIHIPGSVQPFGFMLVVLSDFTICMASDNVGGFLGSDLADLLQRPLATIISEAAVETIRGRVDHLSGPDATERLFGIELQAGKPQYDLSIHFSGVYLIIEAEPSVHEPGVNSGELVRLMLDRIRKTRGMTDLARELQEIYGVPVIDGVAVAVKQAEALVSLGLSTSKRGSYASPLQKRFTGAMSDFAPA